MSKGAKIENFYRRFRGWLAWGVEEKCGFAGPDPDDDRLVKEPWSVLYRCLLTFRIPFPHRIAPRMHDRVYRRRKGNQRKHELVLKIKLHCK